LEEFFDLEDLDEEEDDDFLLEDFEDLLLLGFLGFLGFLCLVSCTILITFLEWLDELLLLS